MYECDEEKHGARPNFAPEQHRRAALLDAVRIPPLYCKADLESDMASISIDDRAMGEWTNNVPTG